MTDEFLLIFGCCVSFLALAGAWIFLRGRALETPDLRKRTPEREEARTVATAR